MLKLLLEAIWWYGEGPGCTILTMVVLLCDPKGLLEVL